MSFRASACIKIQKTVRMWLCKRRHKPRYVHTSTPLLVTVIAHALQTQCEDLFSNTYVSVVSLCCLHRFGVFEKLSVMDLNYVLDQLKIFLKV